MTEVAEPAQVNADLVAEAIKDEVMTNGGKEPETAAAGEDVKNNDEASKNDTKEDDTAKVKDDEEDERSGSESESKSPDHKRKEPPISAHERQDRKRSRGGHRYNSNIKSRFDEQAETDDADEIRRQVEFYFSDSNLPIDAYLLDKTGGHRNRPVELKVIHNFKRMRHFQPFSAVRDAVKESAFLDLNDNDEITRKLPLDEKFTDNPNDNRKLVHTSSMPRSIYAKGFGEETKTTHVEIEEFFAPYGPPSSVRLRRHDDGEFKGSVFVEFADEETQQRFLELDPKPQWNDKDLQIMSKQEYVDMKHEGIMDGSVRPRSPRRSFYSGDKNNRGDNKGGRRSGDNYDRRDRDRRGGKDFNHRDDWKSQRDRFQDGESRGRAGGRGRGGDRRGGRGGRGGRRASPDFRDKRRRRSDEDEERKRGDEDEKDVPSRAEAEAKRVKLDEAKDTGAGVEESTKDAKTNGEAADVAAEKAIDQVTGSKKRAAVDDVEGEGEAKKVKESNES